MNDASSSNLALNVRQLRSARQLSQAQLAKLAGIPRPTLAHLESGSANPTLSVLMRLASALHVLIEELVAPPRASARHYSADELPSASGGPFWSESSSQTPCVVWILSGSRSPLVRSSLGYHTPAVRESISAVSAPAPERGGQVHLLREGEVLVFRGDQQHTYLNSGDGDAVGVSIVTLAPVRLNSLAGQCGTGYGG